MTNHICDACETVSHCRSKGCIPLTPMPFRPAPCKGSGETELRDALRELLDAWMCEMPSYEHGQAAQDAWADRRASARNNASALIAATGEPS